MEWLVYLVVALAIGFGMKPKKTQTMQPGEVDIPTAEEGKGVYVLFGTRDIEDPNVVWFGDVEARAVRQRGGKK